MVDQYIKSTSNNLYTRPNKLTMNQTDIVHHQIGADISKKRRYTEFRTIDQELNVIGQSKDFKHETISRKRRLLEYSGTMSPSSSIQSQSQFRFGTTKTPYPNSDPNSIKTGPWFRIDELDRSSIVLINDVTILGDQLIAHILMRTKDNELTNVDVPLEESIVKDCAKIVVDYIRKTTMLRLKSSCRSQTKDSIAESYPSSTFIVHDSHPVVDLTSQVAIETNGTTARSLIAPECIDLSHNSSMINRNSDQDRNSNNSTPLSLSEAQEDHLSSSSLASQALSSDLVSPTTTPPLSENISTIRPSDVKPSDMSLTHRSGSTKEAASTCNELDEHYGKLTNEEKKSYQAFRIWFEEFCPKRKGRRPFFTDLSRDPKTNNHEIKRIIHVSWVSGIKTAICLVDQPVGNAIVSVALCHLMNENRFHSQIDSYFKRYVSPARRIFRYRTDPRLFVGTSYQKEMLEYCARNNVELDRSGLPFDRKYSDKEMRSTNPFS